MFQITQKIQPQIDQLCQDSGISYLAVFGSQARGDMKKSSDIDLLVEFKETPGLIRFIQTKNRFEALFQKKVDLVTKKGLSKLLEPYVMRDVQKIYG